MSGFCQWVVWRNRARSDIIRRMKLWTNPILVFAAIAWMVAFAWFVIHLLRAPILVEEPANGKDSAHNER